jgi:hypothetical protein
MIEVLILGRWYRAHVQYDMGLREYLCWLLDLNCDR